MTVVKRKSHGGLSAPLGQVRRTQEEGKARFAAVDVIAALGNGRQPEVFWADLKTRERALADTCVRIAFPGAGEGQEPVMLDALDIEGVLRLVQSIPTSRAERLRRWLAQTARERLEEENDPELAVVRTRRLYEQRGYSRRWVDKRLRGVSARHELTAEWFKRGATESDQYRTLTNAIMKGAFGNGRGGVPELQGPVQDRRKPPRPHDRPGVGIDRPGRDGGGRAAPGARFQRLPPARRRRGRGR